MVFSVLKLFLFVQISVDSFDDDVVIDGQNDDIGGLSKNLNLKKNGSTWAISDHQTPKKKANVKIFPSVNTDRSQFIFAYPYFKEWLISRVGFLSGYSVPREKIPNPGDFS